MDSTTPNIAASAAAAANATAAATAPRTSGAKAVPEAGRADAAKATDGQPADASSEPQRDPRSLQFQVDGGRVVTTVVDENDQTVVVQIPDAEVLRIAKAIDRMQGFLVEDKA